MKEELYYLQDSRGLTGSRIMFWAKDGAGYTSNISNAHVYTESEARRQNECRETDIPLLKSVIDQAAYKTVDHQYIEQDTKTPTGEGRFYLIFDGHFDGNDVKFVPGTYRLSDAFEFNAQEARERIENYSHQLTAIPKEHADSIARLSVGYSNTLMQEAMMKKLKKPEKIKRYRERFNCLKCGKFFSPAHQYDQYCHRHN